MRVSASEAGRLPVADNARIDRRGRDKLHFKGIMSDSLPPTVQPEAAEVVRVMKIVDECPDVREDIVVDLKERISKGEYKVTGDEIAEMMMRRIKADKVR